MERDTTINTISTRQLGTLLVLALLPLGTEVLPSRLSQAGGAAWLCPLVAGLTGQIDRPFFQMVSGLGFEGAFQRLEELASALWVLGDVALLGLLLLCMRRLLAGLVGRKESSGLGWIVTGGSFLLALPLAQGRGIEVLSVVPVGNLIAIGVISLGLGVKVAFSKKLKKDEKSA